MLFLLVLRQHIAPTFPNNLKYVSYVTLKIVPEDILANIFLSFFSDLLEHK